jgi:DNA polymerase III subunit gamma/tau
MPMPAPARGGAAPAFTPPAFVPPNAPSARPAPPPAARAAPNGAPHGAANGASNKGSNGAPAPAPFIPAADLAAWRAVIELVRAKRPPLASVLEHAALLKIDQEGIVLGFDPSAFLGKQAQEASAIEILRAALAAHFGGRPGVTFEGLREPHGSFTVAQIDAADRKARLDAARRNIVEHPLVTAAIELLGAELRDVRLSPDDAAELVASR